MSWAERFWWCMTMFAITWYISVMLIVSVRGAGDIKRMFKRIDEQHRQEGIEP